LVKWASIKSDKQRAMEGKNKSLPRRQKQSHSLHADLMLQSTSKLQQTIRISAASMTATCYVTNVN